MNIPYQFFLAFKCLKNRKEIIKNNRFLSFVTTASIIGVSLGISFLIAISSLINGFREEIHSTKTQQIPNVELMTQNPGDLLINKLKTDSKIKKIDTFADTYGIISDNSKSKEDSIKIRGLSNLNDNDLSIGDELAKKLDVKVGDDVEISTINSDRIFREKFTVSSIYHTGTNEFDNETVSTSLANVRRISNDKKKVDGILISGNSLNDDEFIKHIASEYGQNGEVIRWENSHIDISKSIKTEKELLFISLWMIILTSILNILNTLFFIISTKRVDVAIFKTLGMPNRDVLMIFMIQGFALISIGIILGLIFGLSIALNFINISPILDWALNYQFIDNKGLVVKNLPFLLNWHDVFSIVMFSIALSIAATVYPSYKATKNSPVKVLNYE